MSDSKPTTLRPDQAAAKLDGKPDVHDRAEPCRVMVSSAFLLADPDDRASRLTEALYGEEMDIYVYGCGWAWGRLKLDGYVGWIRASSLARHDGRATTDLVSALLTHCYVRPEIKAPIKFRLPFASRLALGAVDRRWRPLLSGEGWVYASHVRPVAAAEDDFVAVAEQFVGAPYVWGGKQVGGLDCSALVQLSLCAAGIEAPRDSNMQEEQLGVSVALDETKRRGDLVFWPGHVGIMRDSLTLLHANAWHMQVSSEPLAEIVARPEVGAVRSLRRLRS